MQSRLIQGAQRGAALKYGVAVAAAIVALLIRLPVAPLLGDKVPYITFFLATTASAILGGFGPGVVTTLMGALLASSFILGHNGPFLFRDPYDYVGLAIFVGIGGIISHLAGRLSEARERENALRLLLQQTLLSIGDAIISTGHDGRVSFMNRTAEQLTGWTEVEVKGKPLNEIFRIVKEGSDVPAENPIEKAIQTGAPATLADHSELITRTGRRVPIDDSGATIKDDHDMVVGAVIVFRDITARRQTERALEVAERRARNILESITDAFILLDPEWRYLEVNRAAEEITHASAASLLGKVFWDVYPATVGTLLETSYRRAMAEQTPVHFENYYAPWDQWFEISAFPSREGLAVYFRDITERKSTEAAMQRLNEDLKQFTFAATHDLREPLRMMTVYVQMLQRKLAGSLDNEDRGYITQIVKGGHRIARLIDGLLEFSRLGGMAEVRPVQVNSEAALNEALENIQIAVAETQASVMHDGLPAVMADPVHLSQLFQNLVSNAIKYARPGMPPRVRISARPQGERWLFAIEDNGIGVAPEHHAQIFVPFKRLHGAEIMGAGIGLATCKRIVERYGGRIWIESEVGHGSTFYFTFRNTQGTSAKPADRPITAGRRVDGPPATHSRNR